MAASTSKLTGTFSQQVQEVYDLIVSRICASEGVSLGPQNPKNCSAGVSLAEEWKAYANRNRAKGTVGQLYLAWFLNQSNLPQNLGNDIIQGAAGAAGVGGAIGQNIGSIASGPTTAANGGCIPPGSGALNPLDYWHYFSCVLTNHNLWVRLGEGVVALILLDVGLKAFTNKSVIETVAKKTAKATPVGKIL